MPYLASEGSPRILKMEVMIRIAIAVMVMVPLAVDDALLRPDRVTSAEGVFVLMVVELKR